MKNAPVPRPPQWADKLLAWYCAPHLLEEVQGDLHEEFDYQVQRVGPGRARLDYVRNVLGFVRPFALKRKVAPHSPSTIHPFFMLDNYWKIAWRNLVKSPLFSFITVFGLAIGLAACLLIGLYVRHELSYDAFHSKGNRIYRLVTDIGTPTETIHADITAYPMASALKNAFPEVQQTARLLKMGFLVQRDEQAFQEDNVYYADSTFLEMFSYPLRAGNPHTALRAPFSVVLTEATARRYFGNENPLGKSLRLDHQHTVTVTGVMQDVPLNSHVDFDLLVSMSTFTKALVPNIDAEWGAFGVYTYLLLKPGANPAALQSKTPALLERHAGTFMREQKMHYSLLFEPLTSIYLRSERGSPKSGSLTNLYIFSLVAGFILLIACINFMNLVIARASERAREVGVRKVVGAYRGQITLQFLSEALLLSLLAYLVAGLLCQILLPFFNQLAGKHIARNLLDDREYWLASLGVAVLVGLLAGFYPALVLSAFRPVTVLKGRFAAGAKGLALRRGLVVVQFVISVALTAGTLVAHRQLHFMRSRELGFRKDQMLVLNLGNRELMGKYREILRQQIANLSGVRSVALSSHAPGSGSLGAATTIENRSGEMQKANMRLYSVDFNFLSQYGIKLAAGRGFSPQFSTDSTQALVINEAAAAALGYSAPQEAVGKQFSQWGREGRVIGVVQNFHIRSLKEKIEPLTIRISPEDFTLFSVQVNAAAAPQVLPALERLWKRVVPQSPFSYYFLDEAFDRQYRDEERFGSLFLYFTGLAIFIACLGLFGLTAYTTVQRAKEIGIRKVLGASAGSIIELLSRDFLKLVLVSIVIALPIAWWVMDQWLQGFAYRTRLEWWVFVLAGALAVGISLLTVSFQSVRTALANPLKSLRND